MLLLLLLLVLHASNCHAFVTPGPCTRACHTASVITKRPTTTATSSSSSSRLFLAPLAEEGDWAAYLDDQTTGLVYYFNGATGESLWEPPTSTFPLVALDPNQRIVASIKQQEYKAKVATPTSSSSTTATTTVATTAATTTTTTTTPETASSNEQQQRGGGFPIPIPFFGRKNKSDESIVPPTEKKDEQQRTDDSSDSSSQTKKPRFGFGLVKSVFGGRPLTNENGDDGIDNTNGSASSVSTSAATTTATATTSTATTTTKVTPTTTMPKKAVTVDNEPSTTTSPTTTTTTIDVDLAAYVLPHPAKVRWGGEDAVFVKGRTFGVFDGVSGAEKLDGVPLYSLTLAKEFKSMLSTKNSNYDNNNSGGLTIPQITNLLTQAAEFADKSATGASTAVVASLSDEGDLAVLNLGDSLCVVIRDGKVVARTKEIVHYFDCPYQLSEDSKDRPRDGTKLITKVQKGDVIVMGSDGIFDNLKESELCALVTSNSKVRAAALTRKIVEQSRRVSLDSTADTPYAKLAMRNRDPDYANGLGGKVDDASCIVVKCS